MAALASTSRARVRIVQLCSCRTARRAFIDETPLVHPEVDRFPPRREHPFLNRTPLIYPKVDRIPPQKEPLTTVADVLKAVGRNMDQHESKFESWEALFGADGKQLDKLGVPVKDRKYLMKQLQWYRLGYHPADMATKLKPPKKVRGHGDRIQNGKRVPERRLFRLSHRRSIRRSRHANRRALPKYSPLRVDRAKSGRSLLQEDRHVYPAAHFEHLVSQLGRRPDSAPEPLPRKPEQPY